jgi:rubrerythrin
MKLDSPEEILRLAIRKEADAATFYHMAARKANPGVKKIFEDLAGEEEGHRKKLEGLDPKNLGTLPEPAKEKQGAGLTEAMEDIAFSPDMNYADTLRMAMKNEERARQLYMAMAETAREPQMKNLLHTFAQEESKHKARLERIYEDDILEWF